MTRRRAIFFVGALVVVGSIIRAVTLLGYPVGTGQGLKSPDGNYEFSAFNMTDKTFWQGIHHYYKFELRDVRGNRTIRHWELAPVTGQAPMTYYGPTVITWAVDSTFVVVPIGGGLDLKLSL